ncbi:MAG: hypothetical protein GF311_23130 [Candidatus Lokiarchaeota archaeon]|nr:hypothetical protein [Candidatus Lokiarchaeota archaeon]
MSIRQRFQRFRLLLNDIKPILLSHHPNCDKFSEHVYHLGRYKLCIGCFTYYPTILITIILSSIFFDMSPQTIITLFFSSFLFFLPLILNFLELTKFKILKILTKVSIGIGTGWYILSIAYIPFLPLIIKILSIMEISFFTGVIAYIRANRLEKECRECKYKKDWNNCPGMADITKNLYLHGFKKREKTIP